MRRLLLDYDFYENPTLENYKKLEDELELAERDGFISYSDKEYILAARLRYLKEYNNGMD